MTRNKIVFGRHQSLLTKGKVYNHIGSITQYNNISVKAP